MGPEDAHNDDTGDCLNWAAIDRRTKLVLAFVVGRLVGDAATGS